MAFLETKILNYKSSIKDALRVLDTIGVYKNVLFIVDDENKLIGTLTDGDIRRALLKDIKITALVTKAINENFKRVYKNTDYFNKVKIYKSENIRFLPLLEADNHLISILDLNEFLGFLPVEVVLMAGGRGQRLMPLTESLPKPMLRIGEKPIIEHNIDRLIRYGSEYFHISINYLGNIIQDHFQDGSKKGVSIKYISETKPLGTFGSITLVENFDRDYILLMNSDLLTDINFEDFFNTFIEADADMAVASVPYHIDVPYAVLENSIDNRVLSLKEKPRFTYFSNAGIYLFKKNILELVPKNIFYNTTDLMELLINQNKKLITYPILGYWLDIGRISDFIKAQEDIKHLTI